MHGHTYVITVRLGCGKLNPQGMVVDFSQIKEIVRRFDHHTLVQNGGDDIIFVPEAGIVKLPFNPSCENLCRYFHDALVRSIPGLDYCRVIISETFDETEAYYGGWINLMPEDDVLKNAPQEDAQDTRP